MKDTLSIAYLGDAVYELFIREHLINSGIKDVNDLQKASLDFVSAKSQRVHLERLLNNNILTEEEIDLVKHGRNIKGRKNKNTDIITYRLSTGLEYLCGYLYLNNKTNRFEEIMNYIIGGS